VRGYHSVFEIGAVQLWCLQCSVSWMLFHSWAHICGLCSLWRSGLRASLIDFFLPELVITKPSSAVTTTVIIIIIITAETAAIDGLVLSWSENIFVSFFLWAPGYGLTLWCALGLLVGGAIQVPQLSLQCYHLYCNDHWRQCFMVYLSRLLLLCHTYTHSLAASFLTHRAALSPRQQLM